MNEHNLHYREATAEDIPAMTVVRFAVRENRLSDPTWLTQQMWLDGLAASGNANSFVCERDGRIVGFAIGRLRERDIWALFVDPASEGLGIGKKLLDLISAGMFEQGIDEIILGTGVDTRAEAFYRRQGWQSGELSAKGEREFRLAKSAAEATA